jgi:hypothetical protein
VTRSIPVNMKRWDKASVKSWVPFAKRCPK